MVFNLCLTWAGVYGCTFFKLILGPDGSRSHTWSSQPALACCGRIFPIPTGKRLWSNPQMTKTDLEHRLASHPKKGKLLARATAMPKTPDNVPSGVDRIITSQVNPTIYGTVNLGAFRLQPDAGQC